MGAPPLTRASGQGRARRAGDNVITSSSESLVGARLDFRAKCPGRRSRPGPTTQRGLRGTERLAYLNQVKKSSVNSGVLSIEPDTSRVPGGALGR
ncbi:hypothetical protein EVAR_18112_1 [Eumeta japonica]|uniref:Uncharacterized protein n=1 Tax=Eumeta variegata TaxID=151549 RepID=A0A4C1VIK9_EUMVA|nr:hypothetical protein EVAR_18112_1 [Eumeta japonica]